MVALILAVSCLLYAGDLDLGFFNWDDPTYVTGNPWIKGATGEHLRFVLTQPYFANYSPLHLLSYMLDYQLAGESARAFHLSSNIWGGLAAAGVYLLAIVLFHRVWPALAAVALFVAHPAHVEAIAWISSRKDLVATAFTLPSVAAYFLYRRGGSSSRTWYVVSVLLFALGIAGKLSVAMVPAVLVLFDWLEEGRKDLGILVDKIPYGLVVLFFGLRVAAAQPPMRNDFDLYVFGHSMLQSLWLLTGFGDYVMARGRPGPEVGWVVALASFVAPSVLFFAPIGLRRWVPGMALGLYYWILLSLVPPQVLNFVHPVADRYLFFPSVGAALLLAWMGLRAVERFGDRSPAVVGTVVAVLVLLWGRTTFAYLAEWRDPRSVWYAASTKTRDVDVFRFLGGHYQDQADRLPALLSDGDDGRKQAEALAKALWSGDERLGPLLKEWAAREESDSPGPLGPRSVAYQTFLRQLTMEQFEKALAVRGTRVLPNLYFRLGKLAMETGDLERARLEFERAYDESQKHTSRRIREELAVFGHYGLGLVAWRERDYETALRWIKLADEEQGRFNGNWIPEIPQRRRRLENLVGR
jgi:hypothetical protein